MKAYKRIALNEEIDIQEVFLLLVDLIHFPEHGLAVEEVVFDLPDEPIHQKFKTINSLQYIDKILAELAIGSADRKIE